MNRDLTGNQGKEALVRRMMERSHYSLRRTTLLREDKVNLFSWHASAAYTTDRANRIEKLRREYEAYKQAGPATLR